MHERRDGQQQARLKSVHPGKVKETVAFLLGIANLRSLLFAGVRHLKKVRSQRCSQT